VILLYAAPIFVTVAASVLFKARFTLSKGLSLAITLLGCFLVAGGYNPRQLVANPTGVAAGLAYAILSQQEDGNHAGSRGNRNNRGHAHLAPWARGLRQAAPLPARRGVIHSASHPSSKAL